MTPVAVIAAVVQMAAIMEAAAGESNTTQCRGQRAHLRIKPTLITIVTLCRRNNLHRATPCSYVSKDEAAPCDAESNHTASQLRFHVFHALAHTNHLHACGGLRDVRKKTECKSKY
jgi:hypothetical protein